MSALVTAPKLKAPATARHRAALGMTPALGGNLPTINHDQPLIPVDDCKAIVAEMTAALEGSLVDQATALAKAIIGAFPSREKDQEKATLYCRALVMACAKCPPDLLDDLYQAVIFRGSAFLPSAGEVVAEVNHLLRRRRMAI